MRKEIDLMHVLRVPPLGKVVVEIGSNRYLNLDEIPEAEARRRVLAAVGDLVVFAGGYQRLVDADVAPPLAAAARTPSPSLPQTRDLTPTSSPSPLPPAPVNPAPAPKLTNTGPLLAAATPTMTNIAVQIDEILQRHIAADPILAKRAIHLKQSTSGGLIIEVDDRSYKRPNEIEDKEVRDVIKRALKEWEKA